jgi:PhnB protein
MRRWKARPDGLVRSGRTAMQLSHYLFFTTACETALAFYTECGLGRVVEIKHYGHDAKNPEMCGKIMHARFEGPGIRFYASDNDDAEPMRGFAHFVMMDSRARTKDLFSKLSAGGTITTALGMQPWGAFYGKVTDRFGVQWMLNCPCED